MLDIRFDSEPMFWLDIRFDSEPMFWCVCATLSLCSGVCVLL